ncbi:osteopontin [Zootoca vivipara]|uniref:osteopontin n=1 Tax=Zootoca vivipara TaxID=8524 RepID=UPI00293B971F|nr:osteopontin [Zootoca vivipara]
MMKIAMLCMCLFAIALAAPFGKHHDDSKSFEDYHVAKHHHEHHGHGHHHHHSQSQEHSPEHVNSHESQEDRVSSQPASPSSEESDEITEQQTLLQVPQSESREDDDDHHSDVDHDDHDDSDESDESHENGVTEYPTEAPFSLPVTPEVFTGRGDVPYGMKAKVDLLHFEESLKPHKRHGKFDSHDVSDDVDSTPDVESRESHSPKGHSLESHDTSLESDDASHLRDSHEVHGESAENDSRQKLEGAEEPHDDSYHDGRHISMESHDSREYKKAHRGALQQVHHDHDADNVSNQTFESAEGHHSAEKHHSAEDHHHSTQYHHHSDEDHHHSDEDHHLSAEDRHHSAEDRHSIEDNEVTL